MTHRPWTPTCAAWLALMAILVASCAPTVSRLLAAAAGDAAVSPRWVEVCSSAERAKQVLTTADPARPGPAEKRDITHAFAHCAFCTMHGDALPVRPVVWHDKALAPSTHDMPPAWLHGPGTLHAWVPAQPRAPPLFG